MVTFRIYQVIPMQGYLGCYEFYELSLIHYYQGIMGREKAFQKKRIQHPNNPSYDYNTHLLGDTQEVDTT